MVLKLLWPFVIFARYCENILICPCLTTRLFGRFNTRVVGTCEIKVEILAHEFARLSFQCLPDSDFGPGDPTGINNQATFIGRGRAGDDVLGPKFTHSFISEGEKIEMSRSTAI